jgi:hypothetical protein
MHVQENKMLNELLPFLSEFIIGKVRLNLEKGESSKFARASLFIEKAVFHNPKKRGITLEELSAEVENLLIQEKQPFNPHSSHIIIHRLVLHISAQWLNDSLNEKRELYEEPGLRDVEIVCLPKKLLVRGSFKKGVSFPFSVEIKTGVQNNKLTIELFQFNLMEILPLPHVVQNTLIDIFTEKLKQKFIDIEDHKFHIDVLGAVGLPLSMTLKDFRVEKEQIVLEV